MVIVANILHIDRVVVCVMARRDLVAPGRAAVRAVLHSRITGRQFARCRHKGLVRSVVHKARVARRLLRVGQIVLRCVVVLGDREGLRIRCRQLVVVIVQARCRRRVTRADVRLLSRHSHIHGIPGNCVRHARTRHMSAAVILERRVRPAQRHFLLLDRVCLGLRFGAGVVADEAHRCCLGAGIDAVGRVCDRVVRIRDKNGVAVLHDQDRLLLAAVVSKACFVRCDRDRARCLRGNREVVRDRLAVVVGRLRNRHAHRVISDVGRLRRRVGAVIRTLQLVLHRRRAVAVVVGDRRVIAVTEGHIVLAHGEGNQIRLGDHKLVAGGGAAQVVGRLRDRRHDAVGPGVSGRSGDILPGRAVRGELLVLIFHVAVAGVAGHDRAVCGFAVSPSCDAHARIDGRLGDFEAGRLHRVGGKGIVGVAQARRRGGVITDFGLAAADVDRRGVAAQQAVRRRLRNLLRAVVDKARLAPGDRYRCGIDPHRRAVLHGRVAFALDLIIDRVSAGIGEARLFAGKVGVVGAVGHRGVGGRRDRQRDAVLGAVIGRVVIRRIGVDGGNADAPHLRRAGGREGIVVRLRAGQRRGRGGVAADSRSGAVLDRDRDHIAVHGAGRGRGHAVLAAVKVKADRRAPRQADRLRVDRQGAVFIINIVVVAGQTAGRDRIGIAHIAVLLIGVSIGQLAAENIRFLAVDKAAVGNAVVGRSLTIGDAVVVCGHGQVDLVDGLIAVGNAEGDGAEVRVGVHELAGRQTHVRRAGVGTGSRSRAAEREVAVDIVQRVISGRVITGDAVLGAVVIDRAVVSRDGDGHVDRVDDQTAGRLGIEGIEVIVRNRRAARRDSGLRAEGALIGARVRAGGNGVTKRQDVAGQKALDRHAAHRGGEAGAGDGAAAVAALGRAGVVHRLVCDGDIDRDRHIEGDRGAVGADGLIGITSDRHTGLVRLIGRLKGRALKIGAHRGFRAVGSAGRGRVAVPGHDGVGANELVLHGVGVHDFLIIYMQGGAAVGFDGVALDVVGIVRVIDQAAVAGVLVRGRGNGGVGGAGEGVSDFRAADRDAGARGGHLGPAGGIVHDDGVRRVAVSGEGPNDRHVLGGHAELTAADGRVGAGPAGEGITSLGGSLAQRDFRAEGDGVHCAALHAVHRIGHGVFVRGLGVAGRIGRSAGDSGDVGRPLVKGIGVLRVGSFGRGRAVVGGRGPVSDGRVRLEGRAVPVVPGDGIGAQGLGIGGLVGHVRGDGGHIAAVIGVDPLVEAIVVLRGAGLGRGRGLLDVSHSGAVIIGYSRFQHGGAVLVHEGDRVGVDGEVGGIGLLRPAGSGLGEGEGRVGADHSAALIRPVDEVVVFSRDGGRAGDAGVAQADVDRCGRANAAVVARLEGQGHGELVPDGVKGDRGRRLGISGQILHALAVGVSRRGSGGLRRPAEELIICAGDGIVVAGQSLGHVEGEGLIGNAAGAAVGVELDRIGQRRPGAGEGDVSRAHDEAGTGVGAVLLPAGEGGRLIADGLGGRSRHGDRLVGEVLGAVHGGGQGLVADGGLHHIGEGVFLGPDGVEVVDVVAVGVHGQTHVLDADGCLIGEVHRSGGQIRVVIGRLGGLAPAHEAVAGFGEAVGVQRDLGVEGKVFLCCHGAGAAVGVVDQIAGGHAGGPDRGQLDLFDRAGSVGDHVAGKLNGFAGLIDMVVLVGPADEVLAGRGRGGRRGNDFRVGIIAVAVRGRGAAAVGVILHGDLVHRAVSGDQRQHRDAVIGLVD